MMIYNLKNWETKASARTKPHRILSPEEQEEGKVFFPLHLVPVAQHPMVMDLGDDAVKQILVSRLYNYLDFTRVLEIGVVNPVVTTIALRQIEVELPDIMYHDAVKIITDEGYHAYQSDDLINQIKSSTEVSYNPPKTPLLLHRLKELLKEADPEYHQLLQIFFVTISETLISSILSVVPKDKNVITTVRKVVGDHAADEGKHHAFFTDFLNYFWPRLSEKEQSVVGVFLPRLVYAFLEPDYLSIKSWLTSLPFNEKQIDEIVNESYPQEKVIPNIKQDSRPTLQLFKKCGMFENPQIADAFAARGLLC